MGNKRGTTVTIGEWVLDFAFEDVGIGPYEFWGAQECDSRIGAVIESATYKGKDVDPDEVPADILEEAERSAMDSYYYEDEDRLRAED